MNRGVSCRGKGGSEDGERLASAQHAVVVGSSVDTIFKGRMHGGLSGVPLDRNKLFCTRTGRGGKKEDAIERRSHEMGEEDLIDAALIRGLTEN